MPSTAQSTVTEVTSCCSILHSIKNGYLGGRNLGHREVIKDSIMKTIKNAIVRLRLLSTRASLRVLSGTIILVSGQLFADGNIPDVLKADDASGIIAPRIIGGQRAAEGAWPSTVALVRVSNQSLFQRQFCAANLINSRWAVTAAHCLFDNFGTPLDPSALRVAMGFTDLADESDATEVIASALFIHPDYDNSDPAAPHDIALIELAQNTNQPFMRLFDGDVRDVAGDAAIVVGWGVVDFSNPAQPLFPSELNQVAVPIVTNAVCNEPESYNGLIGEGQVCAGFREGGRDSCLGDSGGPLMIAQNGEFRQAGVVSFGRGCAQPNFYGVYSRLSFYKTWISEISGISDFENPNATGVLISESGNSAIQPQVRPVDPVPGAGTEVGESGGSGSLSAMLPILTLFIAWIVWSRRERFNA